MLDNSSSVAVVKYKLPSTTVLGSHYRQMRKQKLAAAPSLSQMPVSEPVKWSTADLFGVYWNINTFAPSVPPDLLCGTLHEHSLGCFWVKRINF